MSKSKAGRTVHVGMMVQWFLRANTSSEPVAAVVTRVSESGENMIQLSLVRDGVYSFEPSINWIRHIDDEFLRDKPNHANEVGAWNFIPDGK